MQFKQARFLAALLAIAALFVVAAGCGDDDSTTSTAGASSTSEDTTSTTSAAKPPAEPKLERVTINVTGGEPDGGLQDLDYNKGDQIVLEVNADAPEEVHIHGYDVMGEVAPGQPAKFDFEADIEGVFEVELENSAVPIAQLTVNP